MCVYVCVCRPAGDYDSFAAVNDVVTRPAEASSHGSEYVPKLPVRWCVEGLPPRQAAIPATNAAGHPVTVGEGLQRVFPSCTFAFAPDTHAAQAGGGGDSGSGAGGGMPGDATGAGAGAGAGVGVPAPSRGRRTVLMASGVALPCDAPLAEVAACLRHADNWLYVVVQCSEPPAVVFDAASVVVA